MKWQQHLQCVECSGSMSPDEFRCYQCGITYACAPTGAPILMTGADRQRFLALLEHVEDPERVVAELHRVLKPNGQVDVVVPFCHPYHAYPADYSRFSRERLAGLFAGFHDVEVGIRTGPTTTMLTFLTYYLKLILPVHGGNSLHRNFNRLIVGALGWAMFPLKYLDVWLNRLPTAHVLANHFYVVARK